MKPIFSVLAICLVIALASCGGDDDCSSDYVGTWRGAVNCSGSSADSILVEISQLSGDTLSIISNGERMNGVLTGCDLELIPTEIDLSIFGTLTITGTFEIRGDDLNFIQMRAAGEEAETCTFIGQQ